MDFQQTLEKFIERAGISVSEVVKRSGIPRGTFRKWIEGASNKPQQWYGLMRVADVLGCNPTETKELLNSAGFELNSLNDLRAEAPDEIQPVLARILSKDNNTGRPPFQVPPDLPYFVGRKQELSRIKKILLARRNRWCALMGMGGIGKTMIAAHLAHQLRALFPDGILWARLDTTDPMHILSSFAAAYGKDVSYTRDLESRSQAVRSILADKHALMILDNVERSADLVLLLPSTDSWAVLLTSRRRDLAMVRRQFAAIEIEPFHAEESLELFSKHMRPQQAKSEDRLFLEIATILGHHPLALDIIASRLTWEPTLDINHYLRHLQSENSHLDILHDEQWNVRTSLKLSYDALSPGQQSLFAALSVFRGSFNDRAVSFITKQPQSGIEQELKYLYQLSLIQAVDSIPARYQLHPLLQIIAKEHLNDPGIQRLMAHYYQDYAMFYQGKFDHIAEEAENIQGALEAMVGAGLDRSYIQLVSAYYPFLRIRGLYELAQTYLEQAVHYARKLDDATLLVDTLRSLGELYEAIGNPQDSEMLLQEGLTVATRHGDNSKRGALLLVLGTLAGRRGNLEQAMIYLQTGAEAARSSDDQVLLCQLLQRLSSCTIQMERYEEADHYLEEGIAVAQVTGNSDAITQLLTNRGELANRRQKSDDARKDWQAALKLARTMHHAERICNLTSNLGNLESQLGRYEPARRYLQEALEIAESLGHVWHQISLWIYWGEWYLAKTQEIEAEKAFTKAATLNTEGQFPDFQAEILYGLARVAERLRDTHKARNLAQESLLLAESNSYPIVSNIRALLNRVNGHQ